MKPSRQVAVVFTMLLVLCGAGALGALTRLQALPGGGAAREVLYVPSPRVLKAMSLGYTGLLADIYWTRAVQYFGNKHYHHSMNYELLAPLLDITTTLDPHLIVAYQFGSIFLVEPPPEGAGQPEIAIKLLEKGIRHNPAEWRLYYHLGFIYFIDRQDTATAARIFEQASKLPDASPWLAPLAAEMAHRAGQYQNARFLWSKVYETADDKMIRANAIKHLRAIQVDEDVPRLEEIVREYRRRNAHLPGNWGDVISAGLLPGVPGDPLGLPYVLAADGRVQVSSPQELPFIHQGLPR